MTNWYIWTPVLCSAAWGVGIIMGLSMGFYFGTRRSVLLFMRYFPTTETMNKLVTQLFSIANQLTKNAKPDPKPQDAPEQR